MVCLGNICINTLHKGNFNDDDDDDDNNNNNNNNNNKSLYHKKFLPSKMLTSASLIHSGRGNILKHEA